MLAIYKKELRQYLYSVTGAIFISVNLFVLGLYFQAGNLLAMNPSLAPVISGVIFILMLMVPILTMRVFAEERRQKTDQLLLTSPVSVFKIVLGKYLALLTVFEVPVFILAVMPLILTAFGKVSYGESYTALLGYFLYGAACLALGLFISSITESQIVAAVLSFIALFVTYIMGGIVSMLTESGKDIFKVLSILDFSSRLENLLNGILDLKEAIYFISIIILLLFLTVQAIEKRRYSVSKKTLSLTVYSSASIAVAVALVIVLNFFAEKIPSEMSEYDTTESSLYSLSDESKKVIKGLEDDVDIFVMGKKETLESYGYKEVEKTLEQFDELSGKLKVTYKDPSVDPEFVKKYTDDPVSTGSVIVVSGEKSRVVSPYELYESDMDYSTYSEVRTAYDGEGQVISAVSYVTGEELPVLYEITGHEEMTVEDFPALKAAISKQNIDIKELNLMKEGEIPSDADAVIILSPQTDLHEDDVKIIKDYLNKGGKAIITADYAKDGLKNLESLFSDYGIEHVNGIVVEGDEYNMYQAPIYLIPECSYSVLTTSIKEKDMLNLFPQSTGFVTAEKEDTDVEEALTTSGSAYAKTDVREDSTIEKEASDRSGPFSLALYVNDGGSGAKLALFGTANIFAEEINNRVGGANTELVTNALGSMISEKNVNAVNIPAKRFNSSTLTVPYGTAMLLGFLFVLVLPLGILLSGIMLYLRRRRK
ncbi:MAG: Gldg family protein [Lachnospiraceae bacterium]|nr:Gldg family protein [Lachnospiraceae bacterium]